MTLGKQKERATGKTGGVTWCRFAHANTQTGETNKQKKTIITGISHIYIYKEREFGFFALHLVHCSA